MAVRCALERVARLATRAHRTTRVSAPSAAPSAAAIARGDFASARGETDVSRSSSNASATTHRARADVSRGFAAFSTHGHVGSRAGRFRERPLAGRTYATGKGAGGLDAAATDAAADADAAFDDGLAAGVLPRRDAVAPDQGSMRDCEDVPVYRLTGVKTGETVTLPGHIFDVPLRVDVAHRVVLWQRNKRRRGLHATKTRAQVKGTTKKARPQKGGGRARVGDLRAPQMRGGGVAHGPVVRSHETGLQRKVRRLGLKVALSAKLAEGRVVVLDNAHEDVAEAKTKWLDGALDALLGAGALAAGERQHSVLLAEITPDETTPGALVGSRRDPRSADLVPTLESRAKRASKNLPHVHVMHQRGLNVYDILRYRSLAITKDALQELVRRIDAPIKR